MKKIIILTIIFVIFFLVCLYAEISLEAKVDKKEITTDESITYQLIITSTESKIPQPTAPKFEGFKVVSQAQSSTVSFAKNNMKTILILAFVLAPEAAGKFTIEPATLKLKNTLISSASFEIEVKKELSPKKPRITSNQPQITL